MKATLSPARYELSNTDKRALLVELAREFPGIAKNSKINWQGAFAARPELKRQFGIHDKKTMMRVYNLASALFKSAPPDPQAPAQSANGTSAPSDIPAVSAGRAPREERVEIVKAVQRGFGKRGGGVNWKAAFKANPEWRTKLGAEDRKGMSRLYAFAKDVRGPVKKAPTTRSAPSEEIEPVVVAGCKFCPNCGANLEMHNQVVGALAQMGK